MAIPEEVLYAVRDRSSLFKFLNVQLKWPVDPEDTFTYEGPVLPDRIVERAEVSRLVPFTSNDPYVIFLAEFITEFRRGDLRTILQRIRAEIRTQARYEGHALDDIIFVCANENYGYLRFVRFESGVGRQPRMSSFGWDCIHPEGTRTLRDFNLPALAMPSTNILGETDWSSASWEAAFDVEKVSKDYYTEYKSIFKQVEGLISGVSLDTRLFTQRLFNRLMFIQFLSKKNWLRFNGSTDYLRSLFTASVVSGESFYRDRLYWLFFHGLGTLNDNRDAHSLDAVRERRGEVPYLNGGLFEMADADDAQGSVEIPNEAFELILFQLFSRFNFTIHESTPDDIEVAVDPEMLGKVFEELVTGRHETGSYYTPRPVVAFMCREALKGYLAGILGKDGLDVTGGVARFVDDNDPADLPDPEAALSALKRVTVCDPACGSGAYLLGMMQELLRLRASLFAAKVKDHAALYERKLEIIERNLYGADKDPFAVNIAMLRLWLSLVVDDERKPLDNTIDVSLPNLKYKICVGDSLTAPTPDLRALSLQRDHYVEDAKKLASLYDHYFRFSRQAHGASKSGIEGEISSLQNEIADLFGTHAPEGAADWRVTFAEVFAPKSSIRDIESGSRDSGPHLEPSDYGFSIILANPPYVRADTQFKHLKHNETDRQRAIGDWKNYRANLTRSGKYTTLYEKWDLYIPFLERASQLLQSNGRMIFIIPDAYNSAKYTSRSHQMFLNNSTVERLDFCSEIDLFDAGVNNTILHIAKTKPTSDSTPIRVRRWGANREEFEKNAERLPSTPQISTGEALFKPHGAANEAANDASIPIDRICYISVGMVIHANERGHLGEFTADDLLSAVQDSRHPKRFVFGKDLSKWNLKNCRYLEWGTARAPGMFRRSTFAQLQDAREKLITVRTPGANPKTVYDNDRLHFDASSVGFVPWHLLTGVRNKSIQKSAKYRDEIRSNEAPPEIYREDIEELSRTFTLKYVLAVMNSKYAKMWLTNQRRSKLHVYPDDWKKLPIPAASKEQQTEIAMLVDKCLDMDCTNRERWEREIDERVAALYMV